LVSTSQLAKDMNVSMIQDGWTNIVGKSCCPICIYYIVFLNTIACSHSQIFSRFSTTSFSNFLVFVCVCTRDNSGAGVMVTAIYSVG